MSLIIPILMTSFAVCLIFFYADDLCMEDRCTFALMVGSMTGLSSSFSLLAP